MGNRWDRVYLKGAVPRSPGSLVCHGSLSDAFLLVQPRLLMRPAQREGARRAIFRYIET